MEEEVKEEGGKVGGVIGERVSWPRTNRGETTSGE